MANLCLAAVTHLRGLFLAGDGLAYESGLIAARDGVELSGFTGDSVLVQNVASDLADESVPVQYPVVYLYTDRMDNRLVEKFRKFSGSIAVIAELRVSGERFTDLEGKLARYIEAVGVVLGRNQGSWTEHLAFSGAYEVRFERIRLGGKNFIQSARVEIELQAHE
ncbi:MAG: hypothetical protein WD733_15290 [Bryobacterales bacterium]